MPNMALSKMNSMCFSPYDNIYASFFISFILFPPVHVKVTFVAVFEQTPAVKTAFERFGED